MYVLMPRVKIKDMYVVMLFKSTEIKVYFLYKTKNRNALYN